MNNSNGRYSRNHRHQFRQRAPRHYRYINSMNHQQASFDNGYRSQTPRHDPMDHDEPRGPVPLARAQSWDTRSHHKIVQQQQQDIKEKVEIEIKSVDDDDQIKRVVDKNDPAF